MSTAISNVIKKVLEARQQGVPLQFNLTGTELDALLIELNYIQREQHKRHRAYARSTTQQNTDPLKKEIKTDTLRRVINWQER